MFLKFCRQEIILMSFIFLMSWEYSSAQQKDDSFDIKKSSFILPLPLPAWKYSHSIGVSYVVLPKDWTLDVINVPMLMYNGKYTLPYGFNFQAGLSTLFVSNRLNFGPFWNHSFNNYHLGIGYQVAFLFGYLGTFGYETAILGWEQQPSLVLGYSFKKTALTLRGDLYWTTSLDVDEGGHTIPTTNPFINGFGITATFEQRLYRNKLMTFGVKVSQLRYHFLAWPAFPVNQYRYIVPEFQLGLKF